MDDFVKDFGNDAAEDFAEIFDCKINRLALYWEDIPVGAKNAVTYDDLRLLWGGSKRTVRSILHALSVEDNGDNYVLIRSGRGKGFYKTDDEEAIKAYKKECLNKGRSNFAPVKKINRILKGNTEALQGSVFNNIKAVRVSMGLSQPKVCEQMTARGCSIDVPMLSKMENGLFLPPPYYLAVMAEILACEPYDLVMVEESALDIYAAH